MIRWTCIRNKARLIVSLLIVLLIAQDFAALPVAAADPTVSPSPVSLDTIRPGHHQEEQAYLHSRRAGANGQVDGQARLDALRQAGKLPERASLPAALTGKRATVGRDAAPPRASWTQLGPVPENTDQLNAAKDYQYGKVSGRAMAVVVGPNTGVIYLGTAGGGVWKSTDDGVNWNSLTDDQDSLAVGSLALDPSDTTDRTLYVGTGEPDYAIDHYNGIGVLKTTDGGASWSPFGGNTFGTYSATSTAIAALAIVGSTVYAATLKGLFSSANGGMFAPAGFTNGVTDLATDGTNIYVVESREVNGNAAAGVYKSNGSGGWTAVVAGLPAGSTWGRAQIAIAKSSPQTLYLSIAKGATDSNGNFTDTNLLGVYTTANGGGAWTATTSQPINYFGEPNGGAGQGWYDQMIAVDPTNSQIVYAGGTLTVATANGGASWSTIADVYCSGNALPCHGPIHPDQHAAAFRIVGGGAPSVLYVANDGGLWQRTDGRWTGLNAHLSTTTFYTGDAAKNYLTNPVVIGGSQDNGTSRSGYAGYGEWAGILGGDGTATFVDKASPNTVWAGYPNGSWQTTANDSVGNTISWQNKNFGAPCSDATRKLSPVWVAPIAGDTRLSGHVLLGGGYVCETTDGGVNVYNVTTNQSLLSPVHSLTVSRTDSATVYAGMENGTIARTTNANQPNATKTTGTTWSFCNTSTLPQNTPVTSIITDQNTASTIYVTFGGFGIHHVWMSTDCTNWTSLDSGAGLPDAPVNSITEYATSPGPTLVVGTDVGVFISSTQSPSWSRLVNGMPRSVPVDMVFTDVDQTTLFAATHGRGMWEVPIPAANAGSISFDRDTLAFGNQPANGPATSLSVHMTNSGPSAVNVGAVTLAGSSAFTITSNGCTNTALAVNTSCPVSVQFSPTAATSYNGALNFNDDGANNPQQVALTGTGTSTAPAVTFNPTSVAFSVQPVGTAQTRIVTLSNTGAGALAISTVTASSVPIGGFSLVGDTCSGQTINGGSACNVTVRFQPPAAQSYTGTLSFNDNAAGSPQTVSLSGSGSASSGPALSLNPSSVTFDNTPMGTTYNAYKAVQITNSGSSALTISSLTLTGSNSGDFGITEYRCQGATLAPNDYCTTYLSFHPSAAGGRSATLNIYSNANADPTTPTTVSLSGSGFNGSAPLIDLRSDLTDFGSQNVGTTSAPTNINILNSGNAPLTLSSITFAGNSQNSADFAVNTSACTSQPIAAGTQCAIPVTFRPGTAGVRKAILIVNDSAADSPQLAFVQGTGVAVNAPAVTLSPQSIAFGNQTTNTTSNPATVTLQNTGTATLSITGTGITTTGDFAQTNTCGTSVAAGASCAINVMFTPTAQTFRTGTVTVTDNASGSPQTVSLNGTGVAMAAGSPAWYYGFSQTLPFGNVPVYGIGVATATIGDAYYATAPMTIIGCTTTGDFVVQNGCDGSVAVGASHDINVQVDPQHVGQQTGNLVVETNDSGSPHTITLTVNGTGAPVVQLPATLDTGNQSVSTTSGLKTVTLKNTGNIPLSINSIAAGGEFAVTSNTCGTSLAAYTTCTINVTFTPTQLGQRTGTLTITDNAAGSPHTVSLTGTGTPPPPKITHLSTLSVPVAGGTQVTITGTGFQTGASVFFGGAAGTVVGTPTATSIVVATPGHAEGTVDVVVANPDGQYSDTFVGFSYIPPSFVPGNPARPGPGASGSPPPPAPGGRPGPGPSGSPPSGPPAPRT